MGAICCCLPYCLKDLLRRFALTVLLVASLAAIGFYAYQNVAVEFYYSWPYATMGSQFLATVDLEEPLVADEGEAPEASYAVDPSAPAGAVAVENYRVLVQCGDVMQETTAYGVVDADDAALNSTVFNSTALGEQPRLAEGVWLDEALARHLGARAGSTVCIIQRQPDVEVNATVAAVVPTYAATQGVVADGRLLEGLAPSALSIYANGDNVFELFQQQAEAAGVEVAFKTREDAQATALLLAQEMLPFARRDVLQIGSVVLAAGAFFLFGSMVVRRQERRFFFPLSLVGLQQRAIGATVAVELLAAALVAAALAAAAALFLLNHLYGLPASPMLYLSTVALLLGGALAGGAAVIVCLVVSRRYRGSR